MTIRQSQSIIRLRSVLSSTIYLNLNYYAERGKAMLVDLIGFYLDMYFDGFTNTETITKEITNNITILASFLVSSGDEVAKICLESNEEDAICLLLYYLFPFIISLIKIKIEKGIYQRTYPVATVNQIRILTQLERRIEIDERGNITESFRYRKQISQTTLNNLLG